MDVFTHTIIAVGSLVSFFFLGEYFGKKKGIEDAAFDVVDYTLDMLERDGLIRVETKNGEKEIVPISEIISDALRNAKT
tara:strand:- start:398 stop:634 length:237 start_codon:yes stop_codon:yes gene_type:complete